MTMSRGEAVLSAVPMLAETIEAHADEAERNRQLSQPVVDALIDAGVFRYLVPASLGGAEGNPVDFYRLVESLAKIDGSTGWCSLIGAAGPFVGQYMSEEAVAAI